MAKCRKCFSSVNTIDRTHREEAKKAGWYFTRMGLVLCSEHKPEWAKKPKSTATKRWTPKKNPRPLIKLSKKEKHIAVLLTNGNDMNLAQAESMVKEILVDRMLRMKKLPE